MALRRDFINLPEAGETPMTLEELKALSVKNGGPLYKEMDARYQVWGPIIVPVRLVWTARFRGEKGNGVASANCRVSATNNASPTSGVLWSAQDRNFINCTFSSDSLSEGARTVFVGPGHTATLAFEVHYEETRLLESFFRVSVWPIWP